MKTADGKPIVHLIHMGDCEGIFARDLKPGMRIVYNYGTEAEVLSVSEASAKYVAVRVRSLGRSDLGTEYDCKRKKDAGIVAYWPKTA